MNKEEFVKLHSDLGRLEMIAVTNGLRGNDEMKSVIASIYECQALIERLVAGLSTPESSTPADSSL